MENILRLFDLVPYDLPMILVGVVLFTILVNLLRLFVFAPYLSVVVAREGATTGAEHQARVNTEEAERLNKEVLNQLSEERLSAIKAKGTLLAHAKAEASKIVEKAEEQARSQTELARHDISMQMNELRRAGVSAADQLGVLVADKARKVVAGGQIQ